LSTVNNDAPRDKWSTLTHCDLDAKQHLTMAQSTLVQRLNCAMRYCSFTIANAQFTIFWDIK